MGKDRRLGLLGMLCLFAAGCFSYGPYGHPATFAPPNTAMAPQPYGTVQVPPGAVWVPASPAGNGSVNAPEPIRKSAPTTFRDEDHEPTDGKAVPQPSEPGKAQPPETTEPFGQNEDATLERRGVKTTQRPRPLPLGEEELELADVANSGEPELAVPEIVTTDDEPRLPRSSVRSAEFRTQVHSNVITPASATEAQYGYDSENYSWLRGVLEFNPKQKTWSLTYSQSPDDNDQFGGEVTLKNPEHFKSLRSGQIVQVVGQFDPTQRDRLGKPHYEASEIVPVQKR